MWTKDTPLSFATLADLSAAVSANGGQSVGAVVNVAGAVYAWDASSGAYVLAGTNYLIGKMWDLNRSAADNSWNSICQHTPTGRLVAVGDSGAGNRVMTSDDGGITWTVRTSAADNTWRSLCLHTPTGRLVAVAASGAGNRVMTSDDGGITWTIRTSAADNAWYSVCQHTPTGRLVAVAASGTGNRVMTSGG